MVYVLENDNEWDRLEFQASLPPYDHRQELINLVVPSGSSVLDAGCGSGAVTRYLAERFPSSQVFGCDLSQDRINRSKRLAETQKSSNLNFQEANLNQLPYLDHTFNLIILRYVAQHLSPSLRSSVFAELLRCLKPGGWLHVIDFDGPFHNLYPKPPLVSEVLNQLEAQGVLDLRVGRKLPSILKEARFGAVDWKIEVFEFQGDSLRHEIDLSQARLTQAFPFLESFLGVKASQFQREFMEALQDPQVVYFYNKFFVKGQKPHRHDLSIVKS